MHSGQWIVSVKCVIEFRVKPVGRRVARSAIVGESERHMRRIVAACKVGCVTRKTVRRRSFEHIVDMARGARQCRVHSGQCVSGVFQVIEFRIEPTVHCVATFAGGWEPGCDVIQYRRRKVLLVAGITGCRQSYELPHGSVPVAVITLQQRMRSNERKTILVIANLTQRRLPPFH